MKPSYLLIFGTLFYSLEMYCTLCNQNNSSIGKILPDDGFTHIGENSIAYVKKIMTLKNNQQMTLSGKWELTCQKQCKKHTIYEKNEWFW